MDDVPHPMGFPTLSGLQHPAINQNLFRDHHHQQQQNPGVFPQREFNPSPPQSRDDVSPARGRFPDFEEENGARQSSEFPPAPAERSRHSSPLLNESDSQLCIDEKSNHGEDPDSMPSPEEQREEHAKRSEEHRQLESDLASEFRSPVGKQREEDDGKSVEEPQVTLREEKEDGKDKSADKSELQSLREQISMIQQQHAYQIQMIQYLQWQLNVLSQQRQAPVASSGPEHLSNPAAGHALGVFGQLSSRNVLGSADLAGRPSAGSDGYNAYGDNTSPLQQSFESSRRSMTSPENAREPFTLRGSPRGHKQQHQQPSLDEMTAYRNPFSHAMQQSQSAGKSPAPMLGQFAGNGTFPEHMSAMLRHNIASSLSADHGKMAAKQHQHQHQSVISPPENHRKPSPPGGGVNETRKLQKMVESVGNNEPLVKNQCRICRRVLSCPSALKLHYRTHTGERPYQCDLCSRAFTTRGNLRTHYSSVHRRELPPASASSTSGISKRGGSAASKTHLCPLCSSVFDDQSSFAQHMQMHALTNQQQQKQLFAMKQQLAQSDGAPTMVTNGRDFLAHTLGSKAPPSGVDLSAAIAHQNKEKPAFSPGQTNGDARQSGQVKREPYSPPQDVARESGALDLTASVSGGSEGGAQQAENGNRSRSGSPSQGSSNVLRSPERYPEQRAITCQAPYPLQPLKEDDEEAQSRDFSPDGRHPDAPRSFQENSSLGSPTSETSSNFMDQQRYALKRPLDDDEPIGEGPESKRSNPRHWCDLCKKQFSSASSLQIHTRTHTGEKPYGCNICGRAFSTKGNLKVHMGTHVWGAGGSRKGRRVSMDNPVMSSWMKSSTNAEAAAPSGGRSQPGGEDQSPESSSTQQNVPLQANPAAVASIYQQYAALAQGLLSRSQGGESPFAAGNSAAALMASRYFQQQQLNSNAPTPPGSSSRSNQGSPEGRTENSLSSDGENEQSETPQQTMAVNAAQEWLWKAYQRSQAGQVN